MLADLLNVPSSPTDWQVWGNSHAIEHQNIIQAIQAKKGVALQQYQLYPIDPEAPADFLERNQHAHSDANSTLGLNSSDLQDLDFADHAQLVAWVASHHLEHYSINNALGI